MPVAEVAACLGRSLHATETLLVRARAALRRIQGAGDSPVGQPATVRYFVTDLDSAVAFYRDLLGFEEELRPSPAFAMLYRGDLRLLLSVPGGGAPMPDGAQPGPGGWNRSPCKPRISWSPWMNCAARAPASETTSSPARGSGRS
jgi:hypothetical protein